MVVIAVPRSRSRGLARPEALSVTAGHTYPTAADVTPSAVRYLPGLRPTAGHAPSGRGWPAPGDHGEDVVGRDGLAVAVDQDGVPPDLAVLGAAARADLLG